MTAETFLPLWEILVPTVSNDGVPYRTRFHRVWDAKVRNISGGLTIYKPAFGQWTSDSGEVYRERMIPVRIACSAEHMAKIADLTAKHYTQLAVMYYRVSQEVHVVNYDPAKGFCRKKA
jgi:hypothetical protein